MEPKGVGNGQKLVYSCTSPGFSTGCSPTTPSPWTSSSWPLPSVMIQWRLTSCAGTLPLLVMRIAPVNPLFHWLVTTYSQLPLPLGAELDDELLATRLELLLEAGAELELLDAGLELDEGLELAGLELEVPPPTMPQGAGCELQVLREIQLRFCSHPQPLWVVTHSGYSVPYQLHC